MSSYTSYYSSPIGFLKIECTDQHVLYVEFCDNALQNHTHPILQKTEAQLDEYFAGRRKDFELPLSQIGSSFQTKVWDLLCTIPFGKTISYQQLAKQYGDLLAIRAIASANGKNKLAISVPCHRVIGSDGSLTGYAGGLHRKKWLLQHELKHLGTQQLELL